MIPHYGSRGNNPRSPGGTWDGLSIGAASLWAAAGYDLPGGHGAWVESAVCAQTDPELFYPEKGFTGHKAQQLCRSCPVRVDCLDWALEHDERFGVWGGLTADQRRQLRKGSP